VELRRLARLHRSNPVRPHHLVILVLNDVAVPDELAGRVELGLYAGDLARIGDAGDFGLS
jgi:hypothetical protein